MDRPKTIHIEVSTYVGTRTKVTLLHGSARRSEPRLHFFCHNLYGDAVHTGRAPFVNPKVNLGSSCCDGTIKVFSCVPR